MGIEGPARDVQEDQVCAWRLGDVAGRVRNALQVEGPPGAKAWRHGGLSQG